jgi:RNA polymerase sigma factor (TIGR02999 family)
LVAWRDGQQDALDRLIPLVYTHLHRLAHAQIAGEPAGQVLQTTALVHETYLRLVDGTRVSWTDRAHFFAVCARLMRRILVDHARARLASKRGGAAHHVTFEEWLAGRPPKDEQLLALDVSPETVTRDWRVARLWLLHELRGHSAEHAHGH